MSLPIIKQLLAEHCPVKKGSKNSCFWGFRGENLWYWSWDSLGNQSPPEHVVWRKNGGDTPKMCSPELRKKSQKNKKNKKKHWTWYFTSLPGGPCWADCCNFLHVGWHTWRNHVYQILSRSHRGLRSYGGPSGVSYSFPNRSYNSVSHYRATLCWLGTRASC